MPKQNELRARGLLRLGDPRDIQITNWELEKEDVMKFKPLYESLYYFMKEEGFVHPQLGDDVPEDLYWERWTPSGAKEQHIWWRMVKVINPFIRYFLHLQFQTLNVTKAEVAYKNRKVSGEKIDLIVRGQLYIQYDYDDKMKNSIAWQFRTKFFNRIYARELEDHKELVRQFNGRLTRLIRTYMDMQTDEEPVVNFYPPMGYKDP
jgi:hypothetical protein